MRRNRVVENRHDRMELASEAGYSKVSLGSVLAGVLVSYGAFAVLAAVGGAILSAFGVDVQAFSDNDWRELGVASGAAIALVLFLSYLYGGYVAGRMARRAGAANGLGVFVLGILIAGGVGAAIGSQTGVDGLVDNLRSIGVPTSGDQFRSFGTAAGLGALLAMLLGSVLGGINGERWHGKLLTRALDPTVGASAEHAAHDAKVGGAATDDRPVEVRGGRHFSEGSDAADEATTQHDRRDIRSATGTDETKRVDVTDTSTTLDDDLAPEHTRTMH